MPGVLKLNSNLGSVTIEPEDIASNTIVTIPAGDDTMMVRGDAVVNVKHFGAVGDGVTDDTTAIQAVIDQCRRFSGGTIDGFREVYFPDGDYLVSSTITLAALRNVKFTGKGKIFGTLPSSPLVTVFSSLWIDFSDMGFENESNDTGSSCITIDESYSCTFTSVVVYGGEKGFHVSTGNNIVLQSCVLRYADYNYFIEAGGNTTSNILRDCAVELGVIQNVHVGFDVSNAYGVLNIVGCYIEGSPTCIYIKNGMRVLIQGCYINPSAGGYGITTDGTLDNTRSIHVTDTQFSVLSGIGYAYRTLSANMVSSIVHSDSNSLGSTTGVLWVNTSDTHEVIISSEEDTEYRVHNLLDLIDSDANNIPDTFIVSGNPPTIVNPIGYRGFNGVEIPTNSNIQKTFSLEPGVTYKFTATLQCITSSLARLRLYSAGPTAEIAAVGTVETTATEVQFFFTPLKSGPIGEYVDVVLYLQSDGVGASQFSGITITAYKTEM